MLFRSVKPMRDSALPRDILCWPFTIPAVVAGADAAYNKKITFCDSYLKVSNFTRNQRMRFGVDIVMPGCTRLVHKQANDIWKSFRAIMAVLGHQRFSDVSHAKKFARWIVNKCKVGEAKVVCKEIKDLAFSFRVWAITDTWEYHGRLPGSFVKWLKGFASHPEPRAQVARFGRCLPMGGSEVVKDAIKNYRKIVRVGGPEPDITVADNLYAFGRDFVRTRKELGKRGVCWEPNEGSASLDFSQLGGGRLNELLADAQEVIQPLMEFTPLTEGCQLFDEVVVETAIEKAASIEWRPKVIAVAEKGYKARVLTKFPACAMLQGDIIRRQIWDMVEDEDWIDADRETNVAKMSNFLAHSLNRRGVVVSSDLSNATDYIPHVYAQALWTGILEELGADDRTQRYVIRMFSPLLLTFPDGTTTRSERGIHMGTPLSFTTLSLLHRYAVEMSGNRYSPHIIRGDDLIGVFEDPERYFEEMRTLGFKINRGKTIVSPKGGVFVERTFRFQRTPIEREHVFERRTLSAFLPKSGLHFGDRVNHVVQLNDIPIAGMVRPTMTGAQSLLRTVGRWYGQIEESLTSKQRKRAAKAITAVHHDVVMYALKSRIPINVPIELGGMGIPSDNGAVFLNAPYWFRAAVGYAASHSDGARAFTSRVRQLDQVTDGQFHKMYTKFVDENESSLRRYGVYTYEVASTDDYRARHRRYRMYCVLGGPMGERETVASRNKRMTMDCHRFPLHKWKQLFVKLKTVGARWVPNRRADVCRLAERLKMYCACYVPIYTRINVDIFDFEGITNDFEYEYFVPGQ